MMKKVHLLVIGIAIMAYFSASSPMSSRKKFLTDPQFKQSSPAYFRQISNVVPYEATAKLLFTVKLPNLETFKSMDNSKMTYQLIQNTTTALKKDFQQYLRRFDQIKRRHKRQLLVGAGLVGGFLLNSVYTKIASKFSGSEEEALQSVHKLRKDLQTHQREFLFFKHQVDEFSESLAVSVNKFNRQVVDAEHIDLALLHLNQVDISITKVKDGLERCIHRLIPVQIISDLILEQQLEHLEISLQPRGYRLAVNASNLVTLEKMRLADCFVTSDSVYVLLNVPVTKRDWLISQLIPIPFTYNSHTCSLSSQAPEVIAHNRDQVKVIDNYMLRFCDYTHDHLCLIPEFSRPSAQSMTCAESLYHGKNVNDLSTLCKFDCINSTDVSVIQVDRAKIIATNVPMITVSCPEKYNDFQVKPIGSIEVTFKCKCQYTVGPYKYDSNIVCIDDSFSQADIIHLLPNFLTAHFNENNELNVTQIIWPKNVAVNQYKSPQWDVEPQTEEGMHYRDGWLIGLSCLIVGIFVALFFIARFVHNLK